MTETENRFGKGGIKSPLDLRDHKVKNLIDDLGNAPIPFNWNIAPQVLDEIAKQIAHTKDQNGSSSCGGQAGAYYIAEVEAFTEGTLKENSAKSLYAPLAYPGGGSVLRDLLKRIVQQGVNYESTVPSYNNGLPPSEDFMTDKSWMTTATVAEAKTNTAYGFAFAKTNIDAVAMAIRDNLGCILRIVEKDNGTWLSVAPLPPLPSNPNTAWSHFVYARISGWHKGKKAIAIHNSWGNVGQNGWQILTEDHFTQGCIKECGVMYDKEVFANSPSAIQKPINWLQQFLNWFSTIDFFKTVYGGTRNP